MYDVRTYKDSIHSQNVIIGQFNNIELCDKIVYIFSLEWS